MTGRAIISASGDAAIRVVSALDDREAGWRMIHHLDRYLARTDAPGVVGSIPSYDALLVELDPLCAEHRETIAFLGNVIRDLDIAEPLTTSPRTFDVPVLYDTTEGSDLLQVADAQGLSVAEVIRLHSEPTYTVRCLGAPGGSPLLDGPALPRPVPRLTSPRPHVPQGMVSVAGRQATITPAAAPGGWHLLGRTPLVVLDLASEPFVPYAPGDLIEFRPIDQAEFDALAGKRMEPR